METNSLFLVMGAVGMAGLAVVGYLFRTITKKAIGNKAAEHIADAIRRGAMTFCVKSIKLLP